MERSRTPARHSTPAPTRLCSSATAPLEIWPPSATTRLRHPGGDGTRRRPFHDTEPHDGEAATAENVNVRGAAISPRFKASVIENPEPGTKRSKTAGACQRLARPGGALKCTPPA